MKKVAAIFLNIALVSANLAAQENYTHYVNPFIGTAGHGHTYPGASLPHGMVQLSPDGGTTGWDWCSGYHYSDSSIIGFSHTHLSGTGCADYGDILFMPTTGPIKLDPGTKVNPDAGYRSRFSHKSEIASPGYYAVTLADYNIRAELTVTKRTGFHKYTFLKDKNANIIIDLDHGIEDKTLDAQIKIINDHTIAGYRRSKGWAKNHCVYFYAQFSKPFNKHGVVKDSETFTDRVQAQGERIKAFVQFTDVKKPVFVKVGISHSSAEGANKNLLAENTGWDFEKIRKQAESVWQQELSAIKVDGGSQTQKRIFYTALYHALLNPNVFSDVDGNYIGMDGEIHTVTGREMYTVFSLWDTFRATHPLFTILNPKRAGDMVQALIDKYDEHGLLPVWELASNETGTMIGYHAIPVIVDAYMKGIRNFDVEKAFTAMKKSAMQDHLGLRYYKAMGYIPSDLENESVSKTLAYAYDDWCIATMAQALGKTEDADYFMERAKFYTNVFDPQTSLMRPKKNGAWLTPFDPFSVSGNYTEANAWQYSFFVPQDVDGLITLMGGDARFISMLDTLFTADSNITGRHQADITGLIGQYAHGNEPSHHMAYLYNYAGKPAKTQERVHEIISTLYTDQPDGLPGNEDCGQMSAWYVMSALGFYPVTPGDNTYIIGTPLFEKATIKVGEKEFVVHAERNSSDHYNIKSARLNGTDYHKTFIHHSDIMKGGKLHFTMDGQPSHWGTGSDDRPKSKINTPFLAVPYLVSGERIFRDSTIVSLAAIDKSAEIFFSLDGNNPGDKQQRYKKPIVLSKTSVLKAVAYKDGQFSKIITSRFNKVPKERSVKLNHEPHPNYTGGGPLALIDGITGTLNFHTEPWQGYEDKDLVAIIDLGKEQTIKSISARFLQATDSWIFFPKDVRFFISNDGENYHQVYQLGLKTTQENHPNEIRKISYTLLNTKAHFVKVVARNFGPCPEWHLAPGGKTWIFIDEIDIY